MQKGAHWFPKGEAAGWDLRLGIACKWFGRINSPTPGWQQIRCQRRQAPGHIFKVHLKKNQKSIFYYVRLLFFFIIYIVLILFNILFDLYFYYLLMVFFVSVGATCSVAGKRSKKPHLNAERSRFFVRAGGQPFLILSAAWSPCPKALDISLSPLRLPQQILAKLISSC